jgi:serine/threonine protein kinase
MYTINSQQDYFFSYSNNENDTKSNRHFYHRHTTGDREHISNNNKKNEINDNQTQDKANKKYNKNHSAQTHMEDDSESKTRANTHSPHGGNSLPKEIIKILNEGIIPQINIDDYTILNQVGEGSYGVIYQVKNNHNKKIFALKKEIAHDENEVKLVYEDVKLINSCNHNNVMKIYGITVCPLDVTTFAIYILMEYADDDWDKEIKKNYQNRINYKEDELIKILKQLTSAFRFLQEEKKIAHRDIKPNNILIFNTRGVKEYKIADFGEAKKAKTSKQMNTLRGTELYMSPALYQGLKQDKDDVVYDPYRSDVFSLGYCFLYAGALNIKIILEVRDVDDMGKLEKILRRYFKNKYTERFIQLMLFMLEFDESKRVDFIGLDNYLNENFK